MRMRKTSFRLKPASKKLYSMDQIPVTNATKRTASSSEAGPSARNQTSASSVSHAKFDWLKELSPFFDSILSREDDVQKLLVNVNKSTREYKLIQKAMTDTICNVHASKVNYRAYMITEVFLICNPNLYTAYQELKARTKIGDKDPVERMLFHGTPLAMDIANDGFPADKGLHFSCLSTKSNEFCFGDSFNDEGRMTFGCPTHFDQCCYTCVRSMLLCRVNLHTDTGHGQEKKGRLPAVPCSIKAVPREGGILNPEYIIYPEGQIYPQYIINYTLVPPQPATFYTLAPPLPATSTIVKQYSSAADEEKKKEYLLEMLLGAMMIVLELRTKHRGDVPTNKMIFQAMQELQERVPSTGDQTRRGQELVFASQIHPPDLQQSEQDQPTSSPYLTCCGDVANYIGEQELNELLVMRNYIDDQAELKNKDCECTKCLMKLPAWIMFLHLTWEHEINSMLFIAKILHMTVK